MQVRLTALSRELAIRQQPRTASTDTQLRQVEVELETQLNALFGANATAETNGEGLSELQSAARSGHVPSCLQLVSQYERNGQYHLVVEMLKLAANSTDGCDEAALRLARLYTAGALCEKSLTDAAHWLR